MRSKATNVLQGVVILTGIVYIAIGLFFFTSPYRAFKLFSVISEENSTAAVHDFESSSTKNVVVGKVTEEDWLNQINGDDIMSPLYYIFRIFSMMLVINGVAMIMPLFDPLRYRGLVYYNGLVFPFAGALLLLIFMHVQRSTSMKIAADLNLESGAREALARQEAPEILVILTAVFLVIFFLTAAGLLLTRKQTKEGRE
jgi:preprotein translocase subunit SecG